MKLYRVMKVDVDGKPLVGTRRNMLGVRPYDPNSKDPRRKFDVDATNSRDIVMPGTSNGLSVSTTSDQLVAGRDEAVWEIEESELLPFLIPVPDHEPHHILEPIRQMTLEDYQAAVAVTRDSWARKQ